MSLMMHRLGRFCANQGLYARCLQPQSLVALRAERAQQGFHGLHFMAAGGLLIGMECHRRKRCMALVSCADKDGIRWAPLLMGVGVLFAMGWLSTRTQRRRTDNLESILASGGEKKALVRCVQSVRSWNPFLKSMDAEYIARGHHRLEDEEIIRKAFDLFNDFVDEKLGKDAKGAAVSSSFDVVTVARVTEWLKDLFPGKSSTWLQFHSDAIEACDLDHTGALDFAESFTAFLLITTPWHFIPHEKRARKLFAFVDYDSDGTIDVGELQEWTKVAMKLQLLKPSKLGKGIREKLHQHIDHVDGKPVLNPLASAVLAEELLGRVDADNTHSISLTEFQELEMLLDYTRLHKIYDEVEAAFDYRKIKLMLYGGEA